MNPNDKDCICYGNWRLIVKEAEPFLGKSFENDKGEIFTFFGVIFCEDDYYYGLYGKTKELKLISCVMSLASAGYYRVI